MIEKLLYCPECGCEELLVRSVDTYYLNSGDFFCHSVKTNDSDAEVWCLACRWEGVRSMLEETP